jgi:hypothetical protein
MSYSLTDGQGVHITQIASVGGMNDLLDFVSRLRVWGPLNNFLETGETENPLQVIADITQFVPYATDPNVRDTLLNLKQGLEKVKGVALICD